MTDKPKSIQLPPERWEELRAALVGRAGHPRTLGLKAIAAECGVNYNTLYRFVNPDAPERGLLTGTLWRLAQRCPVDAAREIARRCLRDGAPGVVNLEDLRTDIHRPLMFARTDYSWGLFEAGFGDNTVVGNVRAATADILWATVCGEYFALAEQSLKHEGLFPCDRRFPVERIKKWAQSTEQDWEGNEYFADDDMDYHFEFWQPPWEAHAAPDPRRAPDTQTPESFRDVISLVDDVANGTIKRPLVMIPLLLDRMEAAGRTEQATPASSLEKRLYARLKLAMHAASISRRAVQAMGHLLYDTRFQDVTGGDPMSDLWKVIATAEATRWSARWQNLVQAIGAYEATAPSDYSLVWTEFEEEFVLSDEAAAQRRQDRLQAFIGEIDWSFLEHLTRR